MRVFILFFLCALYSCSTQQLAYKGFENVAISDLEEDPKMHADVHLYNPNFIGVKIKEMKMSVEIEGKNIGSVQMDKSVRIKSKSDFTIPITCETTYAQIGDVLKAAAGTFFSGNKIPIELDGTITIKKFIFFKKTYVFSMKENFNAKELLH